jgi:hypothetical protein
MLVYGPSKASSLLSTKAWLKPTTSLAVRGKKLGEDPQIGQSACWGCSQESLFIGSSGIHANRSVTLERLLYANYVRYIWSEVICSLSVERVCRVGRVFPCRVYIDSSHYDSRI